MPNRRHCGCNPFGKKEAGRRGVIVLPLVPKTDSDLICKLKRADDRRGSLASIGRLIRVRTTDVYEKNYGGHDTRLWGRIIFPLWLPPAAPAPSMMYRKG